MWGKETRNGGAFVTRGREGWKERAGQASGRALLPQVLEGQGREAVG